MADGEAVLGEIRQAPFLVPPTVSFLTAAEELTETDDRWFAGVSFWAEGCGEGEVFVVCGSDSKTPVTGAGPVTHRPYVLVASDKCSTFGSKASDLRARATRKLIACESKLVEEELWTAQVETNNVAITDGTSTITASQPSARAALKLIEQELADCGCGSPSMIHMRPKVLDSILDGGSGLLRRDGNRWLTAMDNIVVPGRGYAGTGPAGQAAAATEWIYTTPKIYYRRSEIVVLPENEAAAINRATNDATYYAERVFGTYWDTTCCRFALEVTP